MKRICIIKADMNDADYVTSEFEINEQETKMLEHIVDVVSKFGARHNWCKEGLSTLEPEDKPEFVYRELLTQKEIDWFNYVTPYGIEEQGIHTIVSVRILEVLVDERIL